MPNVLASEISARLTALAERLECAELARREVNAPGSIRLQADVFMAATSQHLAGVVAVLAPAVSRLDGGQERIRDLVESIKGLERALVLAKARLYGQAQSARRPWSEVWGEVHAQLTKVAESEAAITSLLEQNLANGPLEELTTRFARVVVQAQTRPHPHLPHLGLLGRMARRVCATTDRLWDELEGRVTSTLAEAS